VVQDQPCVVLHDDLRQKRIPGETAGIVDDLGAMLNRQFGHFRFIGVHRNRDTEGAFEPLQNRNQAADLFRGGDAGAAGLGGFRTDIDDVGALLFQFDRAGISAVWVLVEAAIGEGIGRHVEHRYNQRLLAEPDLAILQLPGK
jgi:hypothetical protein